MKAGEITLPSNTFFNPTTKFIDWFVPLLKNKVVIEVGAGMGLLASKLQEKKLNIVAIDICNRDEECTHIIRQDAIKFKYPRNSIVIIARPNRGTWIYDMMEKAFNDGASKIYYIGLHKHIDEDIKSLPFYFNEVYKNAGKNKEVVYEICKEKPKQGNLEKYHLIVTHHIPANPACKPYDMGPFWYQIEDGDKVNLNGGFMPFDDKMDKILETVEAESWDDLDWMKTSLINDKYVSGWLDRHGKFYGCESMHHDFVMQMIFRMEVSDAEDKGWVRIYGKNDYACRKRISRDQYDYLKRQGFKVDEDDVVN